MFVARWACAGTALIVATCATVSAHAQVVARQLSEHTPGRFLTRTIPPQKFYSFEPRSVPRTTDAEDGDLSDVPAEPAADPSAPYVTYCVRACDGFYFPLRQNAMRVNFPEDAARCASACNGQAKLFYAPRQSGSPQTMIDLEGRRYADTPNAFAYRKAIQPGCGCKPPPWSLQAAARHRGYEQVAAIEVAKNNVARLLSDRSDKRLQPASPIATAEATVPRGPPVREPSMKPTHARAAKFKIRLVPRASRLASGSWQAVTR